MISRNQLANLSPLVVSMALGEAALNAPERLIMKYDLFGQPSAWAPKFQFVALLLGTLVFTNALVFIIRHWLKDAVTIRQWANIPYRDHWLKPEHSIEAAKKVGELLSTIVLAVNFLLLVTLALGRWSLAGASVNFILAFSVAVVFTLIGWSLWSFRPPKSVNRA